MDHKLDHAISEKPHADDGLTVATRAVAFGADAEETPQLKAARPKGVEMKRELTKEDKELANAGYEHLAHDAKGKSKSKGKGDGADGELDSVDIVEHALAFKDLQGALDTAFDPKEPAVSPGLSAEEAKARLARDGQNVLTPPKKKSALRKVRSGPFSWFSFFAVLWHTRSRACSITTASCPCSTSSLSLPAS